MDDSKRARRIKVTKDGPYIVSGRVPLARERMIIGPDGEPEKWEMGPSYPDRDTYALCRCGASKNKPFCDGSHAKIAFDGTETAGRDAYLEHAEKTAGPGLDLTWSEEFCAAARFCHGGKDAWGYAEYSDDPKARKLAVEEACHCPTGSLVAWDKKTGAAIEPKLEPSITITDCPRTGTAGPIWVKGGIAIESADGFEYEKRNRVTLCRCGKSRKKPFCDGSHGEK
ncbi:MAG: CDGSH iron-sulfur domain-containing protein [Acidobacteriota bacterium]